MRAKLWRCFKFLFGFLVLFKIVHRCEHRAWAQSLNYFQGKDIDYWREGKTVKPLVPGLTSSKEDLQKPLPTGSIIRQSDALPFDWRRYEDPKHPEFWDDGGDYVAPRPLREAVANPTPENLEKYAAWQAKRLVVIAEFNQRLVTHSLSQESSRTLSLSQTTHSTSNFVTSMPGKKEKKIDLREVSLLYFYQSSCPHCRASEAQVQALQQKGVNVTFIQLDGPENPPLHHPSVSYSAQHSKHFAITATPTWIFRRGANAVRLQGTQSEEDLQREISSLFKPTPNSKRVPLSPQGVSP